MTLKEFNMNGEVFKTIKIKKDVWKKLNILKLEKDAKTISKVIEDLVEAGGK